MQESLSSHSLTGCSPVLGGIKKVMYVYPGHCQGSRIMQILIIEGISKGQAVLGPKESGLRNPNSHTQLDSWILGLDLVKGDDRFPDKQMLSLPIYQQGNRGSEKNDRLSKVTQ